MQIFHVRGMLEVEATELATHRIAADRLAELRELFETQMRGPIPDGGNHWDADDLLHGSIADASGNGVLAELVRGLRRKTRMFSLKRMPDRFLPRIRRTSGDHHQPGTAGRSRGPSRHGTASGEQQTQHFAYTRQDLSGRWATSRSSAADTVLMDSAWCIDERFGRTDPDSALGSGDTDRIRAPQLQHAVEGHRQLVIDGKKGGALGRAAGVDRRNYAAIATPVTSAQAVNA